MDRDIQNIFICPDTKTIYDQTPGMKNFHLILLCKGHYFMWKRAAMKNMAFDIAIDGKIRSVYIIKLFPYSHSLWQHFQR